MLLLGVPSLLTLQKLLALDAFGDRSHQLVAEEQGAGLGVTRFVMYDPNFPYSSISAGGIPTGPGGSFLNCRTFAFLTALIFSPSSAISSPHF